MKIDEKFARYILSLQSIVKLRKKIDKNYDIPYRAKLENEFPILKEEREPKEFENWEMGKKVYTIPSTATEAYPLVEKNPKKAK